MISNDVHLLLNPQLWVHKGLLPVKERLRDPRMKGNEYIGAVPKENPCAVLVGLSIGKPWKGFSIEYKSPEELLKYWEITQ